MKGWAKKEDCIQAAKSLRVKAWLNANFNDWVPCSITPGPVRDGYYYARFWRAEPSTPFNLILPKEALNIEHKVFRHSVSMHLFECFERERQERRDAARTVKVC